MARPTNPTHLTEALRAELTRRLHALKIRQDLQYWAEVAIKHENPAFSPAPCHRLLLDKLTRVASGEIRKLMVFMPSGAGKSRYLSRIWPAHLLAGNPGINIIGASHNSDFAESEVSRPVQDLMKDFADELGVRPISDNVKKWGCSNGATYLSAGCGAGLMGYRGDIGIIDDPFGSFKQASSPTERDNIYRWYRGDFMSRLKPEARIVLMHQRLNVDDLAGRLLVEEPDDWEVFFLPAVFEGLDWRGEPVETDELGRQIGESVWPSYYTPEFLEERQKDVGPFVWASAYQQRPVPAGGALYKPGLIAKIETTPAGVAFARAWDLAASLNKGDWTVGALIQRNANGTFTILDLKRVQYDAGGVEELILQTAREDRLAYGHVKISLPQDGGASGKAYGQTLARMLAGFDVEVSPDSGSKENRARPLAAQIDHANLSMVIAPWNAALIDEFATFPGGKHDDISDAASRAFTCVAEPIKRVIQPTWGHNASMMR